MEEALNSSSSIREWFGVFFRRRYWLVIPTLLGLVIATLVAFRMEPAYESSATILIESQQIPTTLVASPVTSYADERIAKIRQQILSRGNLLELIERNKLYPRERSSQQLSDVIDLMRDSIRVDLVSADTGPNGGGGKATIAFKLTFTYSDPETTRSVTEQLTSMFIDADVRRRTEQASGTAAFLARRADELQKRLLVSEKQITAVRERFNGALPDQVISSTQTSASLRGELSRLDLELQSVMATNAALAAQMSMPDANDESELEKAQDNLARLTAAYSDTHPDVRAAREVVRRLQQNAARAPRQDRTMLAAELQAGRSRAAALNSRRAQVEAAISNAERLLSVSPQAAYELNNLQRDYDNLKEQYESIRDRQLEAQVAANLEAEEKGERFTLVEAPALPEEPVSPNRPLIILLGVVLGFGLGLVLIIAAELFTAPLHSAATMAALTGAPALSTLPVTTHGFSPAAPAWLRLLRRWAPRKAIP